MKIGPSIINESLHLLKSHIWEKNLSQKYADGEPPLRSELFSSEQMEQYGRILAGLHLLGPKVEPEQHLLSRLAFILNDKGFRDVLKRQGSRDEILAEARRALQSLAASPDR